MFHAVSVKPPEIGVYFLIDTASDRFVIAHPRKIVALFLSRVCIHTHTYTVAISIGSLWRIPRRKTTLTLSRSGELGLSCESGFEGSRVNRHLE